jgi:hypothetical protein
MIYKLFISFLIASSMACAISYQDLREDFKQELYGRQQGLMEYPQYMNFIESRLKRAEKELKVVKYLQQNPHVSWAKEYLGALADYNVASFYYYCRPSQTEILRRAHGQLFKTLEQIKTHVPELKELNIHEELKSTEKLVYESNKEYYKKLGIKFKILSFFF